MPARQRAPLAEVRGLGAARQGTEHFKAQRLTAIALVPLGLWLAASLVAIGPADHAALIAWASSPVATVLLIGLVVATVHHGQLGVQVVLEDYVHARGLLVASLIALRLVAFALATAGVVAVVRIAVGGG